MNRSVYSRFRGLLASAVMAFSAVATAQVSAPNAFFDGAIPAGGIGNTYMYVYHNNPSTLTTTVTVPLPPGLAFSSLLSSSCTVSNSSTPGTISLVFDLSDSTLPPNYGSCSLTLALSSTAPGLFSVPGSVTGIFGTQPIVGQFNSYVPPGIGVSFSPNPVGPGSPSTLLVTIQNPDPNQNLYIDAGEGGNAEIPIGTWDSAVVTGTNPPGCAVDDNYFGPLLAKSAAKVAGPPPFIEDLGFGDGPELFFSAFAPPGGSCVITVQVVSSSEGSFTVPPVQSSVYFHLSPIIDFMGFTDSYPVTPGTLVVQTATGPSFSPARLDFGTIPAGGSSGPLEARLVNNGPFPVSFLGFQRSGAGFTATSDCLATIVPYGSCTIFVTFSATQPGAYVGDVRVTTDAPGSPHMLLLSGSVTAVPVAVLASDPASLSFADQVIGTTSAPLALTITNTGEIAATIAGIGAGGEFSVEGTCPTLAPGASCTVRVTFRPTVTGERQGLVTVTSNAVNPAFGIRLSGRGLPVPAPRVTISPAALDFGETILGTPATRTATVTNSGNADLRFGDFAITGDFRLTNRCPATLAPAASCELDVEYFASVPGTRRGELRFGSNAEGSPHGVILTGRGCRLAVTGRTLSVDCGR